MPFFSIIIPLYNKETFLKCTLKSIFQQSYTDYEIIIVNDGSTDRSLEIAESLKNEKIKIYSQKNQGVSAARNYGIEKATANFCCFLDADDLWKPNHLETLYNVIIKFPNAGLYCNRYETQISKNKILAATYNFDTNYEGYVSDFFKSSLINRIALTSATCIPKKIYTEIGGFEKGITNGEDLDYWIRIALKYSVVISNEITLIYNNQSENNSLSKINIESQILLNLEKYQNEEKLNKSLKQFLDIYRIEYALHFHIAGNKEKKDYYFKKVNLENINYKTKILLKIPAFALNKLLFTKRFLKKFGFDFTVYH